MPVHFPGIKISRIAFAAFLFILSSCSLQKKIGKPAAKEVLTAPPLQTALVGISIYEPATGRYWYNHNADKYFVPASNTKIPTTYAAMKYLGDSLVGLHYHIVNDTLADIAGTGDPTLLHPDYKQQPVFDFLKRFNTIRYKGDLYDDFLGSGWAWGDYKAYYMAQRSDLPVYGNIARFKMKADKTVDVNPPGFQLQTEVIGTLQKGFRVDKPWDSNRFILTDGNTTAAEVPFNPIIGTVLGLLGDTLHRRLEADMFDNTPSSWKKLYSQPTDSVLRPLMYRSDNFFAEQSLLMVSQALLGEMNDARIIDTLLKTDFKDLPQKPRWADGSGLSRYNLFTPQDFVAILQKIKDEFGMQRIQAIFPTGGTGTLGSYYLDEKGFIYAKTGTLSGVVALSGYLTTKKNKALIFSVLVNNHNNDAGAVRRAVEKFIKHVRNRY